VLGSAAIAAVVLWLALISGSGAAWAKAKRPSCKSYPAPGQLAAAHTKPLKGQLASYAVFGGKTSAQDKLNAATLRKLPQRLQATGIILSDSRYLGKTADGNKLYAVPARHFLPYSLAPLRCVPASERSVVASLLPSLRVDYKHAAVCIIETGVNLTYGTPLENCGEDDSKAITFLAVDGTPLLGLATNSQATVEATFLNSPAMFAKVHHNFYEIKDPKLAVTPCGITLLRSDGDQAAQFSNCDYLPTEQPEMSQYQSFVDSQLQTVDTDVHALATAIQSGDLAEAETAWLTAHLAYLLIGQDDKQYGAFGDLGNSIDGTSAGLVDGTADPKFTGFHKIELDLWTDGDLAAAATDTTALEAFLAQLTPATVSGDLAVNTSQGVANWLLRPHEIIEDAIRDTLTGDDDYGSGTQVASITADVQAVQEDLAQLSPTLDPLDPGLAKTIKSDLSAINTAAAATKVDGQWVSLAQLPIREREDLDAAVSAAAESLSQVPDLLTSTGPAAPLS
jgi:iron uptake system EfeUOB component EfeO/EfeM